MQPKPVTSPEKCRVTPIQTLEKGCNMITLKLKDYNRLELEAMYRLLSDFLLETQRSCAVGTRCKICEYKRLCNDCYAAIQYVEDKLQIK